MGSRNLQKSSHERIAGDEAVPTSSERSFGLTFATVFGFVGVWPMMHGHPIRWWALVTSLKLDYKNAFELD